MIQKLTIFIFCLFFSSSIVAAESSSINPIKHVILISFDGLRSDAITALGPQKADAFYHVIQEGASTLNARNDPDYTVTIPNHVSMLTGYPVMGKEGHRVVENDILTKKIHDFSGRYIYSVFDTLNKKKVSTAFIASKLKFNIFTRSYPINQIFISDYNDENSLDAFKELLKNKTPGFIFLHISNPDHVGHREGWDISPGSSYLKEVIRINGYLKEILKLVTVNPRLQQSSVVVITSDHGGDGKSHDKKTDPLNFTVPFMIWGKGVAKGADLYKINSDRRTDPSNRRILYQQNKQPIRNADAANLILSLFGFASVEGSTQGFDKPLKIN